MPIIAMLRKVNALTLREALAAHNRFLLCTMDSSRVRKNTIIIMRASLSMI